MPYSRQQQEKTGFRKKYFKCVTRPGLNGVPLTDNVYNNNYYYYVSCYGKYL